MGENGKIKTDIYHLFAASKTLQFEDASGHYTEILMVKPTWRVRRAAYQRFEAERHASFARMTDAMKATLREQLALMDREQLVRELVADREASRRRFLELYPLQDDAVLTPEERSKKLESVITEWRTHYTAQLQTFETDHLLEEMTTVAIDRQAFLDGSRASNFYQLSEVCLNPETKQKIFPTPEAVADLMEGNLIDQLLLALTKLLIVSEMSPISAREVAESPDFLDSTLSPKPSSAVPPSTETTS